MGAGLLAFLLGVAMVGPLLVKQNPLTQDLSRTLSAPSAKEPLGTDALGRSVLSRLVHGARQSLVFSTLCVASSVVAGLALGVLAGFKNGWCDALIMRLVDGLMAFPGTLLALILAGLLGGGRWPLLGALVLSGWGDYARLTRNLVRRVLTEDYIQSGRLFGFGDFFLARHYILGLIWPHLQTLAALGIGRTILNLSAFGFLGIGLKPPTPEWGAMIGQALPYMAEQPLLVLAPGTAIFVAVLGFNLMAMGYRRGEA